MFAGLEPWPFQRNYSINKGADPTSLTSGRLLEFIAFSCTILHSESKSVTSHIHKGRHKLVVVWLRIYRDLFHGVNPGHHARHGSAAVCADNHPHPFNLWAFKMENQYVVPQHWNLELQSSRSVANILKTLIREPNLYSSARSTETWHD